MVRASEEYLTAEDGVRLLVRSWLPDTSPEQVVLCVHGMSSHSAYFARLGYCLAKKGCAVYALDLRGNGLSGKPGDAESIDRQIADIHLAVEKIHPSHFSEPLHLLGHSLGTGYVLRYVHTCSSSVKSVILLSPAVKTISNYNTRMLLTMATMGFRILLTPHARWDTTVGWPNALRESHLGKMLLTDPACVKEFTYRYTMGIMQVSGKALLRYAASVTLPALILQGEKDGVVAPEGAQRLYERLAAREKQIVMLPDADHDMFGLLLPSDNELTENARQVVEVIHQWLNRAQ